MRSDKINNWQRNSQHNERIRDGRATAMETSGFVESDWSKGSTDSRVSFFKGQGECLDC